MKKLSIPENINLKKEVIKGVGYTELKQILLSVLPALIAVIILWCVNAEPAPRLLALVILLGYITCAFAIFANPEGNQSVYIFLMRWIGFMREQKFYKNKTEKEELYFVGQKEENEP